tara:strand:+ start:11462 stop:12379 length:918 start_codon:yes stop_codon:yes gene_type:complete
MTIQDYINNATLTGGITDSCQAISMLNAARELLWPMDDFVGTIEYGCVMPNDSCFYLPSHIETIRKAWGCKQNIPINNENWYYVDQGFVSEICGDSVSLIRTDKSVVLPVSFPKSHQIGFRPSDSNDIGKSISVTTRNVFGSIVNENINLNSLTESSYGELAVEEIISINKPPTEGAVQVWARGECDEQKIYVIEAFEHSVRYWQYKSINACECILIKGKKKYFPYKENDLYREIDIRNPSALQFASQAIEHQRSRNYKEYQNALMIARTLLERTKEDLKKTSSPGVIAQANVSMPIDNSNYGYE